MVCVACSYENRQGINFCERCGKPLALSKNLDQGENNCPGCDFQNRLGVRFCESCGHDFNQDKQIKKQVNNNACPQCGSPNRAGVNFCEQCGQTLSASVQHVQSQSPKPAAKSNIGGLLLGGLGVASLLLGALFLSNVGSRGPQDSVSSSQNQNQDVESSVAEPRMVVSPSSGTVNDTFTIKGSGLPPNQEVSFLPFTEGGGSIMGQFIIPTTDAYWIWNGNHYGWMSDSSGNFYAELKVNPEFNWEYELGDGFYDGYYYISFGFVNGPGLCHPNCVSNKFYIGSGTGSLPDQPNDQSGSNGEGERCALANGTPLLITPNTGPIGTTYYVSAILGGFYPEDQFTIEVRRDGNQGALVYERNAVIDQSCSIELAFSSDAGDQPGKYRLLVIDGDGFIVGESDFWIEATDTDNNPTVEQNTCVPNLDAIEMSVSPNSGTGGAAFTIAVQGAADYRGENLDIFFKGPDGQYLDSGVTVYIDEECKGQTSIYTETNFTPGLYTALLFPNGSSGASFAGAYFEITSNGNTAVVCASDEYYLAAQAFNQKLGDWFWEIDWFWAENFDQYFTYRFQGGGYYDPQLVIDPSPIECDDGYGYSGQYLANFNPVSGAMTVNEIRIDGPALMASYLDWDEVVPLVVLAHEFGHAVQMQAGIISPGGAAGKQGELQADCFAGAFLESARQGGLISSATEDLALQFQAEAGDELEGTNIPHGTSSERLQATALGMSNGIAGCQANYTP